MGEDKTEEILRLKVTCKTGPDMFIWKLTTAGSFSTASTWEITRSRVDNHGWLKWVWHKSLPKKVFFCMWKTLFQYFPLDDRIQKLGIPMTSACNCCVERKEETLDHVRSTGIVARLVWKEATLTMRVFNIESEP